MKLEKVVAVATIIGALGLGAFGSTGIASAQPSAPAPLKPGHGHDDDWPPPWQDNGRGPGAWHGNDWNNDWNNGSWNNGNWDKGNWWATNRHDWWDDRQGAPPWGWGPPPAYQWAGGPPRPFNYWGYDVNPVWNPGFNQWGIWLFGIFIPIFGIGVV